MSEELQGWLGAGAGVTRPMARVSKHGHPLLYFPPQRMLALQSLNLYPAQRLGARAGRAALKALCAVGLARVLPSTRITFPTDSPTAAFLRRVSGTGDEPPHLAILAGNPSALGRRYILLLYSCDDRPAVVVKVGLNPHAADLIRQESEALLTVAGLTSVAPRVLAAHESGSTLALAMEHIAGYAPLHETAKELDRVLTPWIDTRRTVTVRDVPAWNRLVKAGPLHPALADVSEHLEEATFHPVLYHGDFAPWNIKVQPDGSWRVLDWERGELTGMPCWDWFHCQVQTGLLVRRLDTEAHARHVEHWLNEPVFLAHARKANVESIHRELLLGYLDFNMRIIGPEEGLPAKRALLETLAAQWKRG
jgi:hypothetical protein